MPAKPKTCSKKKMPGAERREERQDHRGDEQHRRQQRAQQDRRGSRARRGARAGAPRSCRASPTCGSRRPPRSGRRRARSAPPAALTARAQRGHLVERRRGERVAAQDDVEPRARRALAGPAAPGRRGRAAPPAPRCTAAAFARSGTITFVSPLEPARERAREDLRALDRLDLAAERVAVGQAGVDLRHAEREHDAAAASRRPRRAAGAPPPARRSAASGRGSRRCPAAPTCGIVSKNGDQNALRPQITSSAGSMVSIEIIAMPDAHRADRAEAGRAVDLGQRQRQQREDHRQRRRRGSPGPRCAARPASPRACPRGGAAPRGSGSRAAARSPCRRRTRAPAGCRRTGR